MALVAGEAAPVADGNAFATLEANVSDVAGNKLAGRAVRLTSDDGNARLVQPEPTDAQGRTWGRVSTTTPGVVRVSAYFVDIGQKVAFLGPVEVRFAQVANERPQLLLELSPSRTVANNDALLQVRLTATGAGSSALSNAPASFVAGSARDTLTATSGTAGPDGSVTTTLRSTLAGQRTLTARWGELGASAPYAFVAGPADPSRSKLLVTRQGASGDGEDALAVRVLLLDAFDNPVPEAQVVLQSTAPGTTFVPAQGTSDANGVLDVVMRSTSLGELSMVAQVVGQPVPGSPNAVASPNAAAPSATVTAKATFTVGPPAQATSSLTAPTVPTVADNVSLAPLLLVLQDAAGHPVVGQPVGLRALASNSAALAAGATVAADANVTDANGTLSFSLRAASPGRVALQASTPNLTLSVDVSFVSGPADGRACTLLPAQQAAVADGNDAARFALQLRDAFGHPVAGEPVTMSATRADVGFSPAGGQTDANGAFVTFARGTVAGVGVVQARFAGTSLGAQLELRAGPASVATSSLAVQPSRVVVDEVARGTVALVLRDAQGNRAAGVLAALATDTPSAALDATSVGTDVLGGAVTGVRGTLAGPARVAATLADGVLTAPFFLVASSPNAARMGLGATPADGVVADGVATSVLTLTVRDAYGNPVPNQVATFAADAPGARFAPASGTSDANGTLTTALSATSPRSTTVTAAAAGASRSVTVGFVAGAPSAGATTVEVSPSGVVANNAAAANVVVWVRDALGNPAPGVAVALRSDGATDALAPASGTSDGNGAFVAAWRTAVAGHKALSVSLVGATGSPNVATGASYRFVAGPAASATTLVDVAPATLVAGGADAVVTVQLRDAFGNAVAGVPLAFSVAGGGASFSPATVAADGNGQGRVRLAASLAGARRLTVAAGAATVAADFAVLAGPPSPAASSFAVAPNAVVADGVAAATATLWLRDAFNNPVAGAAVTASAAPDGTLVLVPAGPTTQADGGYPVAVRGTVAGARTVTVQVGALRLSAPVQLVPGAVDATASTLSLAPNVLVADGAASATAAFVARDALGNAVGQQAVVLATGELGDLLRPSATGLTAADGRFTATLSGTHAGTRPLSASCGNATVNAGVRFVAGAADAGHLSFVAQPNDNVVADGQSSALLRLEVRDAFGNLLAGQGLTLLASSPTARLGSGGADGAADGAVRVLDANGAFVAQLVDTRAGSVQLTADLGATSVGTGVRFVAGPPDAGHSTLEVSPDTALDDGAEQVQSFVALVDAAGNPVPGVNVTLSASGTGNAFVGPSSGLTLADGTFVGALTSTVPEAKQVQAVAGALSLAANVTFVAGSAATQHTTLVASPNVVTAEPGSLVQLTLRVADASDAPVAGQPVSLSVAGGNAAIEDASGVTDANGLLRTTLTATRAGYVWVRAAVGGVTTSLMLPVQAGSPNAQALRLSASPPALVADGNATTTLTARLVDSYNNPLPGVMLHFAADGSGTSFGAPPDVSTDAQGVAQTQLSSIVAALTPFRAQRGGLSLQSSVLFLAGTPSVAASTLSASPAAVVANDVDVLTLQLLAVDAYGNPIKNAPVAVTSDVASTRFAAGAADAAGSGATDAAGAFAIAVRTRRAGANGLTATVAGVPMRLQVAFVAGPADANHSALVASFSPAVADGNATVQLALQLADAYGNAAGNVPVTLGAARGDVTLGLSAGSSDANGSLLFAARSTVAQASTVSANVPGADGSFALAAPLQFVAGPVTGATSSWTSPGAGVVADGNQAARLRLVAKDALGNPAPGIAATASSADVNAGVAFHPASGTTDANGTWTTDATATVAATSPANVDFAGVRQSAPVAFVAGPAVASQSTLSAPATTTVADGASNLVVGVQLCDAFGNAVPGQAVSLTSSVGSDVLLTAAGAPLGAGSVTTGPSGGVQVNLRGSVSGSRTLRASFGGEVLQATGQLVAGAPSSARSSLSASPNLLTADGSQAARLAVQVRDAYDNPVFAQSVVLTATGGSNVFDATALVTDANGVAKTSLRSTLAESKGLTANLGGTSVGADVRFVAGPPAAAASALAATPNRVVADGQSGATLVAQWADAYGNACAGLPVRFAAAGGNVSMASTDAVTDAAGVASTQATSTLAGHKVASASATGARGSVLLYAGLDYFAGAPSGATSVLTASPNRVVADGTASTAITLRLRDAQNNAVAASPLQLAASANELVFAANQGSSGADGSFATTLRGTLAGAHTVVASFGATSLAVPVAFVAGPPSAATSSVRTTPSQAVADGATVLTVGVQVNDAQQNPVGDRSVALSVGGTGNLPPAANGNTSQAGLFSVPLRSTRAQKKLLTANLGGVSINGNALFVAGGATTQSVVLLADPNLVTVADGTATAAVTLLVQDAQGNPLAGQAANFALSGGNNVVAPPSGTTDANGQLALTVQSTRAERKTLEAAVSGVRVLRQLTFVAGPARAATSTLAASPAAAVANGNDAVRLALVLRDAAGNLVPSTPVQFVAGGNVVVATADAATSISGAAGATLTSTAAQAANATATFGSESLTAPLQFVPGPINNANSVLRVSPNVVVANGTSVATLTVALADAFGNPIGSERVQFGDDVAGDSITPASPVTDGSGQASATLASTVAGARTLVAQAQNTSLSARLTFVPGPPSASASVLYADPNVVVADGNSGTNLTLLLRDAYANPISAASVHYASDDANVAFAPADGLTSSSGHLAVSVRTAVAGLRTVAANVSGTAVTGQINFVPGPPSAAQSDWTASPSSDVADGNHPLRLQLVLRDAQRNAIANQNLVVSVSGRANALTASSGATDAAGTFVTLLSSTAAETKNVAVTAGGTTLTQQASFVAGSASSQAVALQLVPASFAVGDGNVAQLVLTATDVNFNPVGGRSVAFAIDAPGAVLAQPNATTDANGRATTYLASRRAGSFTAQGLIDGVTVQTSVTIAPGATDANASTLTLSPNGVIADGASAVLVSLAFADRYGNAVGGQSAAIATTGGNNALDANVVTSDTTGVASTLLRSTLAETKTVTASFAGQQLVASTGFVPGAVDTARSSWGPSRPSATADNNDVASFLFFGRDAQNNPTPQRTVTLQLTRGSATLGAPSIVTDANGAAQVTLRSTVAEAKTVLASVDATSFSADVGFVAGPPATATSTLAASPNVFAAGGSVAVAAVVRDAYGNLVGGANVRFAASGSNNAFDAPSALTDATGTASVQLSSTRAEAKALTASVGLAALAANVTVVAASPNSATSVLGAVPTLQVADNDANVRLTALVLDAYGNPVGGQALSFATSNGPGNDTLTLTGGNTTAAGTLVTQLRTTRAGPNLATFTAGPASGNVALTFVAGAPNVTYSTLVASPNAAAVDDANGVAALVRVRDAFGNLVPNANVAFAVTGPAAAVTPPSAVTDANGAARLAVTSTLARSGTVTASIAGAGNITATVKFTPGAPSANYTAVAVVPNPYVAGTAAESNAYVTVRVADAYNNPVPQSVVSLGFDGVGSGTTLSPNAGLSDANATLVAAIGTLQARSQNVLVTLAGNVTLSVGVTSVAAAPYLPNADFVSSGPQVAGNANGIDLVVTLRDRYGNRTGNVATSMSASGAMNTFVPLSGATDANGTFVTKLTSTRAQAEVVSAQVGGVGTLNANVTFVAAGPNATTSTLVAVPNPAAAGANVVVTATVRDAYGNAVASQNVAFDASGPTASLAASMGTTDANGQASTTLRATQAALQPVNATAQAATFSATVNVVAANANAASSSFAVAPTLLANNGNLAAVRATIRDVYGNVVAGQNVTFAASGANVVFPGGTVAATDANGLAATTVASAQAQNVALSAAQGPATVGGNLRIYAVGAPVLDATSLTLDGNAPAANSGQTTLATVRLRDAAGDVAAGANVRLSVPLLRPARYDLVTDADGMAYQPLMSAYAGVRAVTLQVGGQKVSRQASFVPRAAPCLGSLALGGMPRSAPSLGVANPVLADVDGDGVVDLLALLASNQLATFKGLGNGSFASVPKLTTGASSNYTSEIRLLIVDINNDGYLDAVHLGYGTQTYLQQYLGAGNGNFVAQAPVNLPGANRPFAAVSVADLDQDGLLDLAVGTPQATLNPVAICVYFQGPVGTFTQQCLSSEQPMSYAGAVEAGDVNEDGLLDLVLHHDNIYYAVFLNQGGRRFTLNADVSGWGGDHTLADMDGDGHLDIVMLGGGSAQVNWGLGNGSFSSRVGFPLPSRYNANPTPPADLNGDGRVDFYAQADTTAQINVAYNTGARTFAAPQALPLYGTSPGTVLASADLDGDGRRDVVASSNYATQSFLNANNVGFRQPAATALSGTGAVRGRRPALGLLNADAYADAVVVSGDGSVQVALGDGAGGLGTARTVPTGFVAQDVALADVTLDGQLDLLVANAGAASLSIFAGTGDGNFAGQQNVSLPSAVKALLAVDLNGDGAPDVAAVASSGNVVYVAVNSAGSLGALRSFSTGPAPEQLAAADLNADGNLDLLLLNFGNASLSVLLGAGDGNLLPATAYGLGGGTGPSSVATADLDGDGTLDVIVGNAGAAGAAVSILRGIGDGTLATARTLTADFNAPALLAEDLDGDGVVDLALVQRGASGVAVTLGLGDGNFATAARLPLATPALALVAGDLDADGRMDLVAVGDTGNVLRSLRNGPCASANQPALAASSVSFAPLALASNGNVVAVTASYKNSAGAGIAGLPVAFAATGNGVVWPAGQVASTDANGTATLSLSATQAQVLSVTASAGGVTGQQNLVVYVPGTVAAPPSSLSVTPRSTAIANNVSVVAVRADVRDGGGQPVVNQNVTVSCDGASTSLAAPSGATDANGGYTTTLRSSVAGSSNVVLVAGATTLRARVRFVAGPVDPVVSTLVASPNPFVAGATTSITASLRDQFGNAVLGQGLTFAASGGNTTLSKSAGVSNAAGASSSTLGSTLAQTQNVTVTSGAATLRLAVTAAAASPNLTTSSLVVSPNVTVAGNGAALTILVRDRYGNPAPGRTVTFASTNVNDVLNPAAGATDANGTVVSSWSATRSGGRTLTANVATVGNLTVAATVLPAAANAATSSVVVSPTVTVAGVAGNVQATLRDAYGNGVPGQPGTFAADGGNNAFTSVGSSTDANGSMSATLTTVRAQAQNVTASFSGTTVSTSLLTVPAAPTAANSTFVANPNAAPATGFAPVGLTLSLVDAYGNAAYNAQASFASPGTQVRLPVGPTGADASGTVRAGASSQVVQATSVVASFSGATLGQNVSFTPATPTSALSSSLVISPNVNLPADGNAKATLTATMRDGSGNLLPFVPVSLHAATNNLSFAPRYGATNANGVFVSSLTSRVSGPSAVVASTAGVRLAASVNYLERVNTCRSSLQMANALPATRLRAPSGSGWAQVVAADADQDGLLDVAFVGDTITGVAWGRGDGSFDAPSYIGGTFLGYQVQLVDLNGDGRLDVLRSSWSSGSVYYALQQSGRTFGVTNSRGLGPSPFGIVAGDWDQDGKVDLAVTGRSDNALKIYRATTALNWALAQNLPTGASAGRIYAADVNGDNANDLLVCSLSSAGITVFLRGSDGNFLPGTTYATGLTSNGALGLGDVNGDGWLDFVAGDAGVSSLAVMTNRGDGTFQLASTVSTAGGNPVVMLADTDKDGRLDIVAGTTPRVYLGNGNASFQPGNVAILPSSALLVGPSNYQASGDFTGDGNVDLFALVSDRASVFAGAGNGTFVRGTPAAYTVPSPFAVVSADMDGDGILDLVTANNGQNSVSLLRGAGDGTFVLSKTFSTAAAFGVRHLAVADLNLDGRPDIVACDTTSGGSSTNLIDVFLASGGGNMAPASSYDANTPVQAVAIGDWNGDGIPDVAGAGGAGGTVLFFGDGTGALGGRATYASGTTRWVAAADLNGDGNLDLVTAATLDANYRAYLNAGDGTLAFAGQVAFTGGPSSVLARDFSGDGIVDVVALGATSTVHTFGRGVGNGSFAGTGLPGASHVTFWAPSASDFDGDAKLDFADNEQLTLGNGDGTFRAPLSYPFPTNTYGNSGSSVGDFNGDGLVDVAVATADRNAVLVYLNGGCAALAPASPPALATTTVTVSPNAQVADNVATASVTVLVRDANGTPLANVGVALGASGGNNAFVPRTGLTDANGNFFAQVRSTRAQNENILAAIDGAFVQAGPVTFVAGQANQTLSSLSVSPNLIANNSSAATVRASMRDAYNNPIAQQNVTFSSPGTSVSWPAGTVAATDAAGVAQATVSSAQAQNTTVVAALGPASVVANLRVYVAGAPVLDANSLTLSPNNVVANSTFATQANVVLKDAGGQSAPAAQLTLYSATLSDDPCRVLLVTDGNGLANAALYGRYVGTKRVTLSVAGQSQVKQVGFVANAVHCPGGVAWAGMPTGITPSYLPTQATEVLDVTGDGFADLVSLDNNGVLRVFSGRGNGSFAVAPATFPSTLTSSGAMELATLDFNGDGKVDFLAQAVAGGNVYVQPYLGNGLGSFSVPAPILLGNALVGSGYLAVADVDGDGMLDFVVTNANTSAQPVWVYYQGPAGSFVGTSYGTGSSVTGSSDVRVADFDKDGRKDISFHSAGDAVSVLRNLGARAFAAAGTYTLSSGAHLVADVDNDGNLDLVSAGSGNATKVAWGGGNATFSCCASPGFTTSVQGLSLGSLKDLNGDGYLDFAAISAATGLDFKVYLNAFGRSFPAPQQTSRIYLGSGSVGATWTRLVDLNNDGLLDAVYTAGPAVQVLLGRGAGAFAYPALVTLDAATTSATRRPVTGRLNADAFADLATLGGNGKLSYALNDGNRNFGPARTLSPPFVAVAVAMVDFDRDGNQDLVATNANNANAVLYRGSGDGNFAAAISLVLGGAGADVLAADFNADGNPDLVTLDRTGAKVAVALGTGTATATSRFYATGTAPTNVALADLNQDGNVDVVVANTGGNSVSVFLGAGNGNLAVGVTYAVTPGSAPAWVVVADVDGDGNQDVVTANKGAAASALSVLLGRGDGTLQAATTLAADSPATFVAAADLDGDGIVDLAASRLNVPGVQIFYGGGAGTFVRMQRVNADTVLGLAAVDLDADGQVDLVGASGSGAAFYLLPNGPCLATNGVAP